MFIQQGRAGSIACPPASTQEGSTPPLNSKHQSLHQQRPPRLVLFLPGTRLQPQNYTLVALEAAKTGSYVLSLNWVNWGCRPINSGVPTCMENLTVTSAACTVACYRGPLFGEFQPFGPATNPLNLTVRTSSCSFASVRITCIRIYIIYIYIYTYIHCGM